MGLLDDAIREHLELSRRHGADPSEVSRKEQEAFGSPTANTAVPSSRRRPVDDESAPTITARRLFDGETLESGHPRLGEETVELDMGAVLAGIEADEASSLTRAPSTARPVAAGA